MSSSTKCISLYFILFETAKNLVIVFIRTFFFILPRASSIATPMVVYRRQIFSFSVSRFLYLLILLYSLHKYAIICWHWNQLESMFLFVVFNHIIWSIGLYFSISLESKVHYNNNTATEGNIHFNERTTALVFQLNYILRKFQWLMVLQYQFLSWVQLIWI